MIWSGVSCCSIINFPHYGLLSFIYFHLLPWFYWFLVSLRILIVPLVSSTSFYVTLIYFTCEFIWLLIVKCICLAYRNREMWIHRIKWIKNKLQMNIKISLPIVGIVVTISPSFNLYKIVVFPAASNPTKIKIKVIN